MCCSPPGLLGQRSSQALTVARIVQSLCFALPDTYLSTRCRYDGPFNGGVELSGCAGGGKPFAKDPVVAEEQLAGDWRAEPGATCWVYAAEGRGMELQQGQAAPDRWGGVAQIPTACVSQGQGLDSDSCYTCHATATRSDSHNRTVNRMGCAPQSFGA